MQEYLIIGETLRDVMCCYHYMCRLLRDKIVYASQRDRKIVIDDYILRFTSGELYWRQGIRGNRAEVINCEYVERQLDRYRTLKGELND